MGYRKIPNLYQYKDILDLKECYALEKIHGTSCNLSVTRIAGESIKKAFTGCIKHDAFIEMLDRNYPDALNKIETLREKLDAKSIAFYGEGYGGGVLRMGDVYGPTNFIVFEVLIDDIWQSVTDAEKFAIETGLPFVHYERGAPTLEWLDTQRNKPSEQAKRNGMGVQDSEGVVLKPLLETLDRRGNRMIAKYKREKFRETTTPREIDVDKLKALSDAQEIAEEWVTENRLEHVISKLRAEGLEITLSNIPKIISAMIEDIRAESDGEIEWDKMTGAKIGGRTAQLVKVYVKNAQGAGV